jgi:hypothetical protein
MFAAAGLLRVSAPRRLPTPAQMPKTVMIMFMILRCENVIMFIPHFDPSRDGQGGLKNDSHVREYI